VNKFLPAAGALAVALVLQVSIAPYMAVFGVVPNFIFLGVVTLALTEGPVAGGVSGLVGGLLFDLLGTSVVGPYALVLTLVGYTAGLVSANMFAEGWLLPVTVVAIASLATEVVYGIVLAVLGVGGSFWHGMLTIALPGAFYHALLAVLAYPLLARLLRSEQPMRSFRRLA
jgi:rod shape-determining protein MreD